MIYERTRKPRILHATDSVPRSPIRAGCTPYAYLPSADVYLDASEARARPRALGPGTQTRLRRTAHLRVRAFHDREGCLSITVDMDIPSTKSTNKIKIKAHLHLPCIPPAMTPLLTFPFAADSYFIAVQCASLGGRSRRSTRPTRSRCRRSICKCCQSIQSF